MTLSKGSMGDDVRDVQTMLVKLGFLRYTPDGIFGSRSKQAVIDFQQAYLVDGTVDGDTFAAMRRAVAAQSVQEAVRFFGVPDGFAEIEQTFGVIEYEDAEGGSVVITNDFVERYIITADLPVVGRQLIHRKMQPVFTSVLKHIQDAGLDGMIEQFGTWNPRHKMHDPRRPLSTHSWGIACDINWARNPVGKVGDLDPQIVAAFERHGFQWGGRWRTRDDMHFQLASGF